MPSLIRGRSVERLDLSSNTCRVVGAALAVEEVECLGPRRSRFRVASAHVATKDELVELMLDRVLEDVPLPVPGQDHHRRRLGGRVHRFAESFSAPSNGRFGIPVHYMGLWDTVKAAGVLQWNMRWPYTRQVANALTVRPAISIDEKRRPHREYPVIPDSRRSKSAPSQEVEQVWFSGVHSDVIRGGR
ncbi:DUF2235 domain-containing protein [Actinosynnema sp. NPDC002837]